MTKNMNLYRKVWNRIFDAYATNASAVEGKNEYETIIRANGFEVKFNCNTWKSDCIIKDLFFEQDTEFEICIYYKNCLTGYIFEEPSDIIDMVDNNVIAAKVVVDYVDYDIEI